MVVYFVNYFIALSGDEANKRAAERFFSCQNDDGRQNLANGRSYPLQTSIGDIWFCGQVGMQIENTKLAGCVVITPKLFTVARLRP